MTNITITGVTATKKGIRNIIRDLKKTGVVYNRLGRALRDDARNRITTQDNGNYDKLSKWTRARTGRRKALITERKNINFRISGGTLVIGHSAKGDWNIEMHEKGFRTPGFSGRSVTIPLKNPRALKNVSGNSITIRGAKESVVPARRVFSTEAEATRIGEPIVVRWIKDIIKRNAGR